MTTVETKKDKTESPTKNETDVLIEFSKRALKALQDHVSKIEDGRPTLKGYCVEKVSKKEILICSTNGKSLVRVKIRPVNDNDVFNKEYKKLEGKIIIPPTIKTKKRNEKLFLQHFADGFRWTTVSILGVPGPSEPVTFIEGRFPNVENVWPNGNNRKNFQSINLDGKYFPKEPFIISFFGLDQAVILKWTGHYGEDTSEDIESIVMPIVT